MIAAPITFYGQRPDTGSLVDRFGRRLSYLRISVTDRCNMRCEYCRPVADAYRAEAHKQILSFEEIERISRLAAGMGVQKLRITGGEPLVRRGLPELVAMLAAIPGITDLSMSSNASLLSAHVEALAQAGLQRINISLDSLRPLHFRKLTGFDLAPVLEGIAAAKQAGLSPIKLNTVLMRGINAGQGHSEVAELIDFAERLGSTIRFIELMPMRHGLDWKKHYIAVDEVLADPDVQARVDTAATAPGGHDAARYLPLRHGKGSVGFITPMSERFCDGCNRLRLTANGRLRACLPGESELNLRELMRSGGNDDDIRAVFMRSATIKPLIGTYGFDKTADQRSMIHIGG